MGFITNEAVDIIKKLEEKSEDTAEKVALGLAVNAMKHFTSGTYECFHCGSNSVVWDSDFDLEDFGYEGVGVVHECHCANCGADITYAVRFDEEE